MGVLKTRTVKSSLLNKGFEQRENDHDFFHLYYNGKKTSIRTKVSHGESEIDDHLIDQMKKQTKLTKSEFLDLVNCPLSKDEYFKILLEAGHIKQHC